jgi:Predicted membrane protein/domain
MSAKAERAVSVRESGSEEVILEFDAERLKAPFVLRCGALIIDYILLVIFPVLSLIAARAMGNDGVRLLKSDLYDAGLMIAVLLGVTNFLVFPMLNGQSLGKTFTGIRIVSKDGRAAGYRQILLRHLVGYPLIPLTCGLGFLLSLFNAKGRALHDIIAGTVVVYGRKKSVRE